MKHLFAKVALAVLMVLGWGGVNALAQQVSGTVTDANGDAVIGAAVMVQGTTRGTTTDIDGSYTIAAAPDAVLEFKSIGYADQSVPVNGRSRIDVVMDDDALFLDDVVVVGYGVQKKSVVTASIAKVSSEDIEAAKPLRVDSALKGLAAGVNVTSSSGQPGASSRIRIRGTGTINNSDPLYIVDGMPIDINGIDFLNPSDIESIEVLKDAASGAVYGARAANGVILVTTKKGVKGNAKVNYNFSYGVSSPWREREVLNASEYAIMRNEGRINAGMAPIYADPFSYGEGTDWQKAVFNYNAPQQNHELSVSGASDKVNYYLSLGYVKQEGIVGGNFGRSNYDRLTLRSNTTYELFNMSDERDFLNRFALTSNVSYANVKSTGISTNSQYGSPLGSALALSPILGVFATESQAAQQLIDYAGEELIYDAEGRMFMVPGGDYNEMVNPIASLSLPASQGWKHQVVSNFAAELDLIKDLRFRSSVGFDLSFWGNNGYTKKFYLGSNNRSDKTVASSESDHSLTWQLENTLTYSKEFGRHGLTVLLGQSAKDNSGQYLGGSRYDLVDLGKPYIDYATGLQEDGRMSVYGGPYTHARLASYFFRASWNYDERYMAEVTVRRDGSSRFGSNNKWATFPSISLGWNLHKERFLILPSWWDVLKARFSWGENGNEAIGNFRYTVLTSSGNNYIFGENEAVSVGVKSSGLANQSLRWETSRQTNAGVDMAFLRQALTFTVDWYRKVTDGMLMEMVIPSYVGESKPIGNVGVMSNSGVEMEAGYKFGIRDARFRIGGNLTYLKNKLIEYGNETGWANLDSFQTVGTISRAQNGLPFPYFYGYKTDGIFQNQEEINAYVNKDGELLQPTASPGDVRFVDFDENGKINEDDRTMIGNGTPDWTWGLTFNADWKGLDFFMLWQGTIGNDVYDATRRVDIPASNLPAYMLNRWTGEGTSNRIPRYVQGDSANWQSSDLYVYDGSYARLKNIQLGYTLPSDLTRKVFISSLRFYVGAENLITLTKYHGYDPEISSGGTSLGIDYGVYPQARTLIFGVNVGF